MTDAAQPLQHLCICADDFGLSAGINAAVLDLIERGSVSATGCLVRRDAWQAGLPALRRIDVRKADIGLHLDLTPPREPGSAEPALAPLVLLAYARIASRRELRRAIAEQFSRFEDGMGRAPAFVDGHRHVHQLPVVRDALLEEIASRYASAPPWLRSTRPRAASARNAMKASVIHALGGRALVRAARQASTPTSGALLGVYDFTGGQDAYRERVLAWLGAARSGDVLMCHPSTGDGASTPHDDARIAEHRVLAAIDFPWTSAAGKVVASTPLGRQGAAARAC